MYNPCVKKGKNRVPILSRARIDDIAEEYLKEYQPEALKTPMEIDIEGFMENYLGAIPDYQFLSHNMIYLGMTIFHDRIVPVYRKEGAMFPMYAQIDLSIAQQNIWLMTESLGLGGVWMGVAPIQERMDAVRKILDLPDSVEAFSLFPLGYPAETRKQQDRFEMDRIHFIR